MIYCGFDHKFPELLEIMLYTQCLANSHKNPQTVNNYLSGAKTFLRKIKGNFTIFDEYDQKELIRGIHNRSTHIPSPAPRIPLTDLFKLSDGLRAIGRSVLGERAAILVMYASFLRQSNILFCLSSEGRHMLQRRHLVIAGDTLWVLVTSSKTTSAASSRWLPIQRSTSRHCPVYAWHAHVQTSPAGPTAPAFLSAEQLALEPHRLTLLCRSILKLCKSKYHTQFSLHSLRRTGAIEAILHGASEADVRLHGLWSSDSPAFHTYVPKSYTSKTPSAISKSLASQ